MNHQNRNMIERERIKESLRTALELTIEQKVNRYLDIDHQKIIGNHYFARASSECIKQYVDGHFIGAVMMSHSINEALIKFIAEKNGIEQNEDGKKETEELITELKQKQFISEACAEASMGIWKSYRNDV